MRIFGLTISRTKSLNQVSGSSSWRSLIGEPYAGAWQLNDELTTETKLAFYAVYSCITLIANDIGKLKPRIVREDENGIWSPQKNSPFASVLKKPNGYQNHIQFKQWWVMSKLTRGNTYALKVRDARGMVTALYLLDPTFVTVLVSDDGSVFYQLRRDNLSGLNSETVTVPASEIIHDRMNCLFHPLVGVSPLYACGLAAGQGLAIQQNAKQFFANGSQPGGVLSAPGAISDETAKRLKATWETNYSGKNAGKIAVVGDGLKYEPMIMSAVDAQMVELLQMSAETVCSAYHVPKDMVGVGADPTYSNAEARTLRYYSQCLQSLIEEYELVVGEGLSLPRGVEVQLDLEGLLRMDSEAQAKVAAEEIKAGYLAPDEARKRRNLPPVEGGATPYMQQQNYSLAALARRDSAEDPFNPGSQGQETEDEEGLTDEEAMAALEEGAEDE